MEKTESDVKTKKVECINIDSKKFSSIQFLDNDVEKTDGHVNIQHVTHAGVHVESTGNYPASQLPDNSLKYDGRLRSSQTTNYEHQ